MNPLVYHFEAAHGLGKELLGGKGAGLSEMMHLGLPVPNGFIISTPACLDFLTHKTLPVQLWDEVLTHIGWLEQTSKKVFGGLQNPLLVSVRSGAKFSMPGMMDTLLNLGLNDQTTQALADETNNPRFAWDSYRRFIALYGDVVQGIPKHRFDHLMDRLKEERQASNDLDLNAFDLEQLTRRFKSLYLEQGDQFPEDPMVQLENAVRAVFASWNNRRAVTYRQLNSIPDNLGTAVTVQEMVFGNLGQTSGTGVGFTRDPNTGENKIFGEFLFQAQGEDVVAGIRTPEPLEALERRLPDVHSQLVETVRLLERHYQDMQDFEFTVEQGKLFLLQTRGAKRTSLAAAKVAIDLALEGLISRQQAIERFTPSMLEQVLHPRLISHHQATLLTKGLPASPGAVSGAVVFSSEAALEEAKYKKVLLVTTETSPEDIAGMNAAVGILTARGGMTSHAAVVARGMGKPAVVGAETMRVNPLEGWLQVGDTRVLAGEILTLDGASGQVFLGEVAVEASQASPELEQLLLWADAQRRLKIRANADTPKDATRARQFGAEGIGLCRTEHMFFGDQRLPWVRQMIMTQDIKKEQEALSHLLEMQRNDFQGIFLAMDDLPVTVRLLDPPLHEFLPVLETLAVEVALQQSKNEAPSQNQDVLARVRQLHETNPMMGLRGVRLLLTRPAILEMQVRAIAEAACDLQKKGKHPRPEIMIPLVGLTSELSQTRALIKKVLEQVFDEQKIELDIPIGTMIEIPRACLIADQLATQADFFSFGTNDLTQMTLGFSRDDAQGKFLSRYLEMGVLEDDPFATLDTAGVGQLVEQATQAGLKARADLKIGVCGEHGGDPASINYFHQLGLDYVSCSPFRIPIARLSAAHAALKK